MTTNEDGAPANIDKPLFADSPQNAYLNDFFCLCLNNIHHGQCLSSLKFVSGDPESIKAQVERVYPEIEEGERGDGVPEVKVYSKELVAYMSSFQSRLISGAPMKGLMVCVTASTVQLWRVWDRRATKSSPST